MITKEVYDKGLRCRGLCTLCGDVKSCYQFKQAMHKVADKMWKRPPLGIEPEWLWKEKRAKDLHAAICRYTDANLAVPIEWVEEYNKLISK